MTKITITRHYIASNVADRFSVGNNEHDGNASIDTYVLPAGYHVDVGCVRDPNGIECSIVLGPHNGPRLISRIGNRPDVDLRAA